MTGATDGIRDIAAMRGMEDEMRVLAIVILAVGILALAYGGFSYTKDTHDTKIGPLEVSFAEKQRVNIPVWAGVAFTIVGAGLLVAGKK